MRTRRLMLGLVVLAMLSAGCAEEAARNEETGAIEEEGELDVFSFALGDCFDSGVVEDAGSEETFEVGGVTAIPCDKPHYAEVFHLVDMDDAEFPGEEATESEAIDTCLGAFEGYVGIGYDESALDIGGFWPTPDTWESGDREIVCYLYSLDGSDLTGTMKDSKT